MPQLLCCCFQKKFKRKQISALKPHQAYLSYNPNEYVLENINQQTFTKNVYDNTNPNKIFETDDSYLASPEIPPKQQSIRTLTRQIQSYPSSPKRQDDFYISNPSLEPCSQNKKLSYDGSEVSQQTYNSKPKILKNSFQKQSNDYKKLSDSEYKETNNEPFPYKIEIGERKFTSVIYESPPKEILQNIQKKIRDQRLLESLTEKLEPPLYCDFSIENGSVMTSSSGSRKWQKENGNKSYFANNQNINGKMHNEEIYDRKETQNMIPEKEWENYVSNNKPYNHQILTDQLPESSFTSTVTHQKSFERDAISANSNKYSESNKTSFKNEDKNLVYITGLKQNEGKHKSVIGSSINALNTKLQVSPRKVIRRSRDNDIFVEQKQHPISAKAGPQYINVGKGSKIRATENELFVTDYLNQFSSIFVDNLKDPIPKDPMTRPMTHNIYVPPNSASQFKKVPDRKAPKNTSVIYSTHDSTNRNPTFGSKVKHGFKNFTKYDQNDSSSDIQSEEEQRKSGTSKKTTYRPRRKNFGGIKRSVNVNTALIETKRDVSLYPNKKSTECLESKTKNFNKNYLSSDEEESNDETLHGLRCIGPNKEMNSACHLRCYSTNSDTSPETTDSGSNNKKTGVFFYPTKSLSKDNTSEASSSTNKLRWKIVIKRGNENS